MITGELALGVDGPVGAAAAAVAANDDGLWPVLRREALEATVREPGLARFLGAAVLHHDGAAAALASHLGRLLGERDFEAALVGDICAEAFAADPSAVRSFEQDMRAVAGRDPACRSFLQPFLFFKGVAALQAHRVAHWLWMQGRETSAFYLQSRVSARLQVDIHPAASLGAGILLDHATGIVIGETSVVGDDVSILQSVTLGGTGKECGDRHPKVGRGALLGVGAKILGNIVIGKEARVAAGSVVLRDVPAYSTVAGVPARIVRGPPSA